MAAKFAAGGTLHVLVGSHVVDQRDEAVVEHGEIAAQDLFGGRDGGALGVHGLCGGLSGSDGERDRI